VSASVGIDGIALNIADGRQTPRGNQRPPEPSRLDPAHQNATTRIPRRRHAMPGIRHDDIRIEQEEIGHSGRPARGKGDGPTLPISIFASSRLAISCIKLAHGNRTSLARGYRRHADLDRRGYSACRRVDRRGGGHVDAPTDACDDGDIADVPAAGFTLGDLKRLHESGKISSEEFEKARSSVVAATKRAAERMAAAAKKPPPPKDKWIDLPRADDGRDR